MSVPALPPLPPRSATELIDGAVQLVRPQFGYFLRIAAVGAIPALIQAVLTLVLFPTATADPQAMLRRELSMLPLSLLSYAFATMQSGAIIGAALALLRGDPLPTVWASFVMAFKRILSLLGANVVLIVVAFVLIVPVAAGLGFLAAANPEALAAFAGSGASSTVLVAVVAIVTLLIFAALALTLIARSAIMTTLVIAEGLGPLQSLKRAHQLAEGSNLRLAATYGLLMMIVMVIYIVLGVVAFALIDKQALLQALVNVVLIPVVPIFGAVMLLTYADLRVRREGADLDAALDALTGLPSNG